MGSRIRSGAVVGIDGLEVMVEVDVSRGLPGYQLVGLPSAAVRESRQRVLAAVRNSGFSLPLGKVTINLRPADIRKEGTAFDLAIALGIIQAAADRRRLRDAVFLGELSLFGELRPVRGLLAIVLDAAARGCRRVVVPAEQAWEAGLVTGLEVIGAVSLAEVVAWWRGGPRPPAVAGPSYAARSTSSPQTAVACAWSGLVGQAEAQRAAEIAAAGRHNLLLTGAPGSGKTRLATAMAGLLPELTDTEVLEVSRIHSAAGELPAPELLRRRPFRAPHHTVTRAGLVGGGAGLRPGEVTLAHRGVLFLDEVGELPASVLDVLRQPLEGGIVTLTRGGGSRRYPADFQLVAAMNPCRCGYRGSSRRRCTCSAHALGQYAARLSGPLLDRIDLFVEMSEVDGPMLERPGRDARWALDRWRAVRRRVASVRKQLDRSAPLPTGDGSPARIARSLGLVESACEALEAARRELDLSVRGILRCARVARTIARLAGSKKVESPHVAEALGFRREALPVWEAARR